MSDKAKRSVIRAGISGVALLGAVGAAMVLWQGQAPLAKAQEAPMAQPVREALDGVTYGRVRELRVRLGLTNQALAAMGLTQAQAEGALERVVGLY